MQWSHWTLMSRRRRSTETAWLTLCVKPGRLVDCSLASSLRQRVNMYSEPNSMPLLASFRVT